MFTSDRVCRCWCCAESTVPAEDSNEIKIVPTKNESAVLPGPEVLLIDAKPKDDQKVSLKKIVKDFIKIAQEGLGVSYFDPKRGVMVSGVFRLGRKLQEFTIAATGDSEDLITYSITDIDTVATVDSAAASKNVLNSPEIELGVIFKWTPPNIEPLLLEFGSAEEQFKFYAACNVIKHLATRRLTPS